MDFKNQKIKAPKEYESIVHRQAIEIEEKNKKLQHLLYEKAFCEENDKRTVQLTGTGLATWSVGHTSTLYSIESRLT
jgi:hypothetical protein